MLGGAPSVDAPVTGVFLLRLPECDGYRVGMDSSPFPYQGPLEPGQVRGRDELVQDLTERVTERRVTALLGPRRYGKTSVLRRITADLSEVTPVWVDLYEVTSMADVAVRRPIEGRSDPVARNAARAADDHAERLVRVPLRLVEQARRRPLRRVLRPVRRPMRGLRSLCKPCQDCHQRYEERKRAASLESIHDLPAAIDRGW